MSSCPTATISPPEIGKVHMDTVKHIFQSFEQGKIETIPLSFSPKAECIYPATSSLPWSGTWSGADCLLQFIDKFDKFESVNLKSETYFTNEEGDVAVFVEEDNKNKATGKPIKMTCAMGFKFDDQGKITRFEDICNTLLEASALPPQ